MLADNGALLVVMAASVMATEAKYKNTELYFLPPNVWSGENRSQAEITRYARCRGEVGPGTDIWDQTERERPYQRIQINFVDTCEL